MCPDEAGPPGQVFASERGRASELIRTQPMPLNPPPRIYSGLPTRPFSSRRRPPVAPDVRCSNGLPTMIITDFGDLIAERCALNTAHSPRAGSSGCSI